MRRPTPARCSRRSASSRAISPRFSLSPSCLGSPPCSKDSGEPCASPLPFESTRSMRAGASPRPTATYTRAVRFGAWNSSMRCDTCFLTAPSLIARARAHAAPVGGLVRQARLAAGLTQAELAGSEMTKALISHIEHGRVRPSLRTLHVIARRLGRDVHEFLDEADPQVRQKRVAADLLAAEAAATQGQWDEVERRAKAALRMDPPHGQRMTLLRLQSWAEVEGGRFEAALDLTDRLFREADPDTDAFEIMEGHHARGLVYGRTGDAHLAVQELERGREIMERAEVRDPAARGRLLVALGTAYRRTNRTAKAITTYETALALGAQSEQLRVAAQSFMGVGAALYDSGELEGAIANYARALEL